MLRTIEAVVEEDGRVRLLEPVDLQTPRRALLTILDEPAEDTVRLPAQISEAVLKDWNRPEEEAAWRHLQPEA
jgi:hypothetical protein